MKKNFKPLMLSGLSLFIAGACSLTACNGNNKLPGTEISYELASTIANSIMSDYYNSSYMPNKFVTTIEGTYSSNYSGNEYSSTMKACYAADVDNLVIKVQVDETTLFNGINGKNERDLYIQYVEGEGVVVADFASEDFGFYFTTISEALIEEEFRYSLFDSKDEFLHEMFTENLVYLFSNVTDTSEIFYTGPLRTITASEESYAWFDYYSTPGEALETHYSADGDMLYISAKHNGSYTNNSEFACDYSICDVDIYCEYKKFIPLEVRAYADVEGTWVNTSMGLPLEESIKVTENTTVKTELDVETKQCDISNLVYITEVLL